MKVSPFQLCIAFAAVCFAFGEEATETQQRTSLFKKLVSPVTFVYTKTKRGLGGVRKMLTPSRKKGAIEEGETAKSSLAEGLGAMMDVLDEAAADGEAAGGKAATATKDAADESTASAEEAVAETKETLSAAGGKADETVTAALGNAAAGGDAVEELGQHVKDSATEAQDAVEEEVADVTGEVKVASESSGEEL